MEPGNLEVVAKICLVCGLELSAEEVKAGWAVCEGCQGYRACLMCGVRLSKDRGGGRFGGVRVLRRILFS